MQNLIDDLHNKLLCANSIGEEEFLALHYGITLNYLRNRDKQTGVKTDITELEEKFDKVMKSLPKYAKYFDVASHPECVDEYRKALPEELNFSSGSYATQVSALMDMAIGYQAELGDYSHNSGVNIDNDRTNYTNSVIDFETASAKFTPEFIKQVAGQMGITSPEGISAYQKKTDLLCKNMAENAINDKTSYYTRVADYLIDFYADNEIAKREEEESSI